jgi:histidinol-phosphate aminotransferase
VLPSQANFILARPPWGEASAWQEQLREKKILVRWFSQPGIHHYLRITIGTPEECTALVRAAKTILR